MTHSRVSILVTGFAALVSAASGQSYGSEAQVLTIGAAEFRPFLPVDTDIHSDGYFYYNGSFDYLAPLSLPDGALVERLCVYANDSHPSLSVSAALRVAKLAPGGDTPLFGAIGNQVISNSDIGYSSYCSEPFYYTLRGTTDIDGDLGPDAVVYYVGATIPSGGQSSLGVGGVQIIWKRQLSPPPSAPTFGDVPANDLAFPYIEALAASGITAGCAGGNFCPDANLTRRQMAVFLAKALGLHWAD